MNRNIVSRVCVGLSEDGKEVGEVMDITASMLVWKRVAWQMVYVCFSEALSREVPQGQDRSVTSKTTLCRNEQISSAMWTCHAHCMAFSTMT